ncbi:MAG: glycosyltransferase family 2 protein [Planctomycetaceae bacterium]|nr:glycosyltransferase family 2 protein [Planctomycetaceae bacterium]
MPGQCSKTAVIIVTFNASSWIERCIESVLNQHGSVLRIIAVDNCSDDDTLEKLKPYQEQITVINSPNNIGFGRANNLGFEKAISWDCDYCFLLNQDAWIKPQCIARLIEASLKNPNAGILSPIHCLFSSEDLHPSFQAYLPKQYQEQLPDKPFEVEFVQAALWMIPMPALLEVGGFDPVFFMYGEDNDFISRMQKKRYSIAVVPGAMGHHRKAKGSPSINRLAARNYWKMVNSLRFSEHSIGFRYATIGINTLFMMLKSVCTLKFRRGISYLLAFRWVTKKFKRIEDSRKSLAISKTPFLECEYQLNESAGSGQAAQENHDTRG